MINSGWFYQPGLPTACVERGTEGAVLIETRPWCLYISPHMPQIPTHMAPSPCPGLYSLLQTGVCGANPTRRSGKVKACSRRPPPAVRAPSQRGQGQGHGASDLRPVLLCCVLEEACRLPAPLAQAGQGGSSL